MDNSISTGTKELGERERKTTTTAFDASFRLRWSTFNQSGTTASTASEASAGETTTLSTILLLAAVKEGSGSPAVPSTAPRNNWNTFCLPYRIWSRECLYTCVNLENYRVFVVKVIKVILISCRDPKYEYPASGGVQLEIRSGKAC